MNMVEMEQKALRKKLEQEVKSFQSVIDQLNQASLTFERKAGDKDMIFGSVSTTDIKEALEKMGMEVEKKRILLAEPIKRLGNYTIPIKVFHDERAEIKVEVKKEGAVEEEKKLPEMEEKAAEEKKQESPVEPEPEKKEEPSPDDVKEQDKAPEVTEEKESPEDIKDQAETTKEVPDEKIEEPEEKAVADPGKKPEESSENDTKEKKDN
jgi:large subunit ribosomal protein L9